MGASAICIRNDRETGPDRSYKSVLPTPVSLPLVSGVAGQIVESVDALEIDCWIREDQSPTALSGCVETLAQLGVDVVMGFGPDSTMGRRIGDAWPDSSEAPVILSSLESPPYDGDPSESDGGFARTVAQVYEAGLDISFPGLFAGEVRVESRSPPTPSSAGGTGSSLRASGL